MEVDPHWSAVLAIAEEEAQLNQDYELAVSLSGGQQPAHPRHSHPNSSGPSGSLQRDFLQQASIAQRYREEYSRVEARATVPRAQARRAQAARTTPTAPAAPPTPVSPTTPAAPTPTSFHSHFSQFFAPHLATPTSPSPFQIFYNSPPPRSHPAQRNSASDAITISDTSSSSSESPIPSFTSMPDPHKSKGLSTLLVGRPGAGTQPSQGVRMGGQTCMVCCRQVTSGHLLIMPCADRHVWCGKCMQKHLKQALADPSLLPLRCCGPIDDSFVNSLLGRAHHKLFQDMKAVRNGAFYCPSGPTCGRLIKPQPHSTAAFQLCACGLTVCLRCRSATHAGYTCEHNRSRLHRRGEAEAGSKAKACPQCRTLLDLEHGCYHITCVCGHEFCFVCSKPYKNKEKTCGCPGFDVNKIIY